MIADLNPAMNLAADPFFAEIKARIIARTGLAVYEEKAALLAEKVEARTRALGIGYAKYLACLHDGFAEEWDFLIDEVTVGETFFFRYPEQWEALKNVVIPERLANLGEEPLRVLCAGCANGAEPFSLSIVLRRDVGHRERVSIVGVDVSKKRLAQAESASYGAWELRATPERYRNCFESDGRSWRLAQEYRSGVEFRPLNLVEDGDAFAARHAGEFDILLCRNVMIYFAAETNRRLLQGFHRCLKEGGWFITGHAEPYLEISNVFRPEPAAGAMLYRKGGGPRGTVFAPPPPAKTRTRRAATPARPRPAGAAGAVGARPAARNLDEIRRLANGGDWKSATVLCERLAGEDPLNAEIQFLTSLVCAHTGDRAAQRAALKRAVYLDPDFALAHYHLALVSASQGDNRAAQMSLRNVFASLAKAADGDSVSCGDGLTAGDLRGLAGMHIGAAGRGS